LNVSITSQTGDALASGSINQLAAGSFDGSSINIGMDTSSVGAKSGQVNFALASDGTGTSGLNTLALSGQLVNVSGLVYGYANPFIQQTSLDLGARRVGDAATTASIVIANQAPADLLHEGLDAALSSTPVGFSASGNSITDLRPATDGALGVSFNAATAGNYSGQATIALASNGTVSNLENTALTDGQVNLSGRVYAAAVANLSLPAVDFGIVHVGDTVSNQSVTLSNTASGSLTDNLSGQYNNTAAPFNLSGNLDNIAAGNSANLNIALNTSTAGIYSNNTTLSLVSRNAEMADLALADQTLGLSAQVNNYANPELLLTSGNVGFNFIGGEYVLDFGNLQQGSTPVSISLSLANSVIGPADALRGSFDTSGVNAFSLTGFNSFSGIEAGQTLEGLLIEFLPATLGIFQNTATVSLFGYNASGYDAHIVDIRLVMNGQVSAVPLPASAWFMLSGLGIILAGKRRQLRVG